MAWPKGRSRRDFNAQQKLDAPEVAPEGVDPPLPTANVVAAAPIPKKKKTWAMKAGNNWDNTDPTDDVPDRLHIPKSLYPRDPDMDLQWCTQSVYGQDFPQRMSSFYRKGWTPVHPTDFDGRFDGMFTPKGSKDVINVDGLVLCARPLEMSLKAKKREQAAAREQVAVKEAALTGGGMEGVTGANHPSAKSFNHINRSIEQIEIPKE